MASDITTAASFATSNMKPSPGEQGDALWAQKVSDNTGFLYYRRYQGPTICYQHKINTPDRTIGTYYFQKQPGLNNFNGSFTGFAGANSNAIDVAMKVDGTTFFSSSGNGTVWKFGTAVSVASLTDGNFYQLTYDVNPLSINTGSCLLALTTWFAP